MIRKILEMVIRGLGLEFIATVRCMMDCEQAGEDSFDVIRGIWLGPSEKAFLGSNGFP